MSKKLIITEEERNDIKTLYNINEQFDMEAIIQGLLKKLDNKFKSTIDDLTSDSDDSKTEKLDDITDKGQKLLDNQSFQDKLDDISDSINIESSIARLPSGSNISTLQR